MVDGTRASLILVESCTTANTNTFIQQGCHQPGMHVLGQAFQRPNVRQGSSSSKGTVGACGAAACPAVLGCTCLRVVGCSLGHASARAFTLFRMLIILISSAENGYQRDLCPQQFVLMYQMARTALSACSGMIRPGTICDAAFIMVLLCSFQ
jgi:hypothetical protein